MIGGCLAQNIRRPHETVAEAGGSSLGVLAAKALTLVFSPRGRLPNDKIISYFYRVRGWRLFRKGHYTHGAAPVSLRPNQDVLHSIDSCSPTGAGKKSQHG